MIREGRLPLSTVMILFWSSRMPGITAFKHSVELDNDRAGEANYVNSLDKGQCGTTESGRLLVMSGRLPDQ